jgi:hypothetical protein
LRHEDEAMSAASFPSLEDRPGAARPGFLSRIWRETARPFRRKTWRKWSGRQPNPGLDFNFAEGSVEPAGFALLAELVQRSGRFHGPIVEIGTLFGRTTTHLALTKRPEQKIITVDAYCWNPLGLSPQCHYELTTQMLHYLTQSGHVQQLRMDKQEFYSTYNGPAPALVFLDAAHSYEQTRLDIEWARLVGAKIIAGHDYSPRFPGVQQVVHEFGGPKELRGTVFVLP